jgi:hypothetical protein
MWRIGEGGRNEEREELGEGERRGLKSKESQDDEGWRRIIIERAMNHRKVG